MAHRHLGGATMEVDKGQELTAPIARREPAWPTAAPIADPEALLAPFTEGERWFLRHLRQRYERGKLSEFPAAQRP